MDTRTCCTVTPTVVRVCGEIQTKLVACDWHGGRAGDRQLLYIVLGMLGNLIRFSISLKIRQSIETEFSRSMLRLQTSHTGCDPQGHIEYVPMTKGQNHDDTDENVYGFIRSDVLGEGHSIRRNVFALRY